MITGNFPGKALTIVNCLLPTHILNAKLKGAGTPGEHATMMSTEKLLYSKPAWQSLASLSKYYSRGVGVARAPSSAKQPPRVYLLSMYKEPPVSLQEGLRALKAYSLCRKETVNIELKCKVKVR